MTLAQQLLDLSAEVSQHDGDGAERLASLAAAIDSPDPTGWETADVPAWIQASSIEERIRAVRSRPMRYARLERLRNILVLVPILLTWLGLTYAAIGYRAAIAKDPALITRPFLLMWEEGFGDAVPAPWSVLSFLTLSHVALVDVAIIFIVLVITWFLHADLGGAQARRNRLASDISQRVRQVSWLAALELAKRQSAAGYLDVFRQTAGDLSAHMAAETKRMSAIRRVREKEASAIGAAAHEFEQGVTSLLAVTAGFRDLATASTNIASDIGARLEQHHHALDGLATQIQSTVTSVTTSQESSREMADATRRALTVLAESTDRAIPTGVQTSQNVGYLAAALNELRSDLVSGRAETVSLVTELSRANAQVSDALRSYAERDQAFAAALTRLGALDQSIRQSVAAIQSVATQGDVMRQSLESSNAVLVASIGQLTRVVGNQHPNGTRPAEGQAVSPHPNGGPPSEQLQSDTGRHGPFSMFGR